MVQLQESNHNRKIRKCKICEREIRIFRKLFGSYNRNHHVRKKIFLDSDEGVLFDHHVWFCNECWGEIIKYAKLHTARA